MTKEENRLVIVYSFALVLFAVGVILYLRNRNILTEVEMFASNHLVIAWLMILAFYVFRAFIPFLPSFAFYAMSGRIFSGKLFPFLVSFSGVTLLHILSYFIGNRKKSEFFRKRRIFFSRIWLYKKYHKIREDLYQKTERAIMNPRLGTLLLFTLSPFPKKAFGRICGRAKVPFILFLFSSLVGSLPSVVSVTLLGKSLTVEPSPVSFISLLLTVTVTVFSVKLFQKSNQKENKNNEKSN